MTDADVRELTRLARIVYTNQPLPDPDAAWALASGIYDDFIDVRVWDYAGELRTVTGESVPRATKQSIIKSNCLIVMSKALEGDRRRERLLSAKYSRDAKYLVYSGTYHAKDPALFGYHCCPPCTSALLPLYARRLMHDSSKQLFTNVLRLLERARDGKGGWKGYPYYYTLLGILSSRDKSLTRPELAYALNRKTLFKPTDNPVVGYIQDRMRRVQKELAAGGSAAP